MKNVNLRNILIKITENNVDWNICPCITEQKYSRFRYHGNTGEMTSATRRGRQRDDSRVLMRMPGRVYLLPVAVLARPVVIGTLGSLSACPCKNRPLKFSWKMDCLHFFYTSRATYAMNENGLYFDRFAFLIF